ncbi:hypothetical protein BC829DRAFT_388546 [Chytridium lagenaria]|nr:hypothetical protein BC829DRAFT_388546 [Chytridium lagenaria]
MKKLLRRISSVGLAQRPPMATPTVCSPFSLTIEQLVSRDKDLLAAASASPLSTSPSSASPTNPAAGNFEPGSSSTADSQKRSNPDLDGVLRDDIPVLLQQFVRFLSSSSALETEGLFRTAGSAKLIRELREGLEKTSILDFASIESFNIPSVAAVFKQWLRDIPDGLISKKFFQDMLNAGTSVQKIKGVLHSMPRANYCSLEYLLRYLQKVASFSHLNRMTVQNLVIVFAPNVFRCPSAPSGPSKGSPEKYLVESMQITKTMIVIMDHFDELFNEEVKIELEYHIHFILIIITATDHSSNYELYRKSTFDASPVDGVFGSEPRVDAGAYRRKFSSEAVLGVHSRKPTDASWAGHTTESRTSPASSLMASPTLSQRRVLNAAVSETVHSMLFVTPQVNEEPKNDDDDDGVIRPSTVAKARGRSMSLALGPSSYAEIRGAQQSLLDELKEIKDRPKPPERRTSGATQKPDQSGQKEYPSTLNDPQTSTSPISHLEALSKKIGASTTTIAQFFHSQPSLRFNPFESTSSSLPNNTTVTSSPHTSPRHPLPCPSITHRPYNWNQYHTLDAECSEMSLRSNRKRYLETTDHNGSLASSHSNSNLLRNPSTSPPLSHPHHQGLDHTTSSSSVFDTEERALARQELRVIRERIKRNRAMDIENYRAIKAFLNELPDINLQSYPKSPIRSIPASADSKERTNPCKAALERLRRRRTKEGRPYDIDAMTMREMGQEKATVKKELAQLKAFFAERKDSSPCQTPSLEEKEIMRDLYSRYCVLKARLKESTGDSDHGGEATTARQRNAVAEEVSTDTVDIEDRKIYKRLRQEKKQLQLQLHSYQDEFKKKNGRAIQTTEDRAPIKAEYNRYKELRELLAQLEQRMGGDNVERQ